jgi:uncharacterized protein (TIGR04562 family)
MKTVIGGFSTIDVPNLDFHSLEEAGEFLKVYGYDLEIPEEVEAIWGVYDQALDIMQKYILEPGEKIPDVLSTREKVEDIRRLLLYASTRDHAKNPIQLWSCALLRIMHCVAHVENDLFFNYTTEIQDQIFRPFQAMLDHEAHGELYLGNKNDFLKKNIRWLSKLSVNPKPLPSTFLTKWEFDLSQTQSLMRFVSFDF